MDTLSAMRKMIDSAGMTAYAVARKLDKSHTYVSNLFVRGSIPSADRLSTIADACGYDLALMPRDKDKDIIRISPQPTMEPRDA